MKSYRQTFDVIESNTLVKLGKVNTNTRHTPLKQNDPLALKLAREMYGEHKVARVDLASTEEK